MLRKKTRIILLKKKINPGLIQTVDLHIKTRKLKKCFKRITSPQNRLAMIDAENITNIHWIENIKIIARNSQMIFNINVKAILKNLKTFEQR